MKMEFTPKQEWDVTYDHEDGRKGTVRVTTEVFDSGASSYGNGKAGILREGHSKVSYDLRYVHGDLHVAMLNEYFGEGLVRAETV